MTVQYCTVWLTILIIYSINSLFLDRSIVSSFVSHTVSHSALGNIFLWVHTSAHLWAYCFRINFWKQNCWIKVGVHFTFGFWQLSYKKAIPVYTPITVNGNAYFPILFSILGIIIYLHFCQSDVISQFLFPFL